MGRQQRSVPVGVKRAGRITFVHNWRFPELRLTAPPADVYGGEWRRSQTRLDQAIISIALMETAFSRSPSLAYCGHAH
jgi:hypothetical protein